MSDKHKNQFGIRTLLFLLTVTAIALVVIERLARHQEEALVYSLIISLVSATVGVALFGLAGLFAFCIAVTEDDKSRKSENMLQCFHMVLMGIVAISPICLLVVLSIFA